MDVKDYNEYPPKEDTDEGRIAVKNTSDDTEVKKNGRSKKDSKPDIAIAVGKVITLNHRSNTLGVKLNGYGVLVKCAGKRYSVGDEIKLSHTGVFGNADFKIIGIV